MKIFALLFCFLLIYSCNPHDEIICDLPLFDAPASKTLFIKLIDIDNNNLIENETFEANDIIIIYDSYKLTNVVFTDIPNIENLIVLNLFGEQGDNTFRVQLSDSITDDLILNLNKEILVSPCGGVYFTLNSATYNGVIQPLEDFNGNYLITILK